MKNATLSLFLIFFSVALYAQPKRLYTPNGQVFPTQSNGIGIDEDKPAAALHIKESSPHATALRIDVKRETAPSPFPDFAFKVNKIWVNSGVLQTDNLVSIDAKGTMRIGQFMNGGQMSGTEQLQVLSSVGIHKNHSNNFSLRYNESTPELNWKTSNNKNFRFKNATTNAIPLSLSPNGKVGINTEDFFGDHDLYVNGSVYLKGDSPETHTMYIEGSTIAEEMFVKLKSDWPDYVFTNEYRLLPLVDLEKFISQNGHLPDMPTAKEVKEEGLKTGETIRLLTQKVEELTLYILQQQKEIEILKEEFNKN